MYLPLAAFLCFALFPFYWMLISSFKSNPELYNLKANRLWIQSPTLDQFRDLFAKTADPALDVQQLLRLVPDVR